MAQHYHNPFAGMELIAPAEQRDAYDRYCQTAGRTFIDQSPFPRMVDLWFTAILVAARKELKPVDLTALDTFKFMDGSILDRDSWRVQSVMLLAIALTDGIDVVGEPRKMIGIANGLAAAGVPHVVDMLRDGDQEPIWNISEALDSLLRKKTPV